MPREILPRKKNRPNRGEPMACVCVRVCVYRNIYTHENNNNSSGDGDEHATYSRISSILYLYVCMKCTKYTKSECHNTYVVWHKMIERFFSTHSTWLNVKRIRRIYWNRCEHKKFPLNKRNAFHFTYCIFVCDSFANVETKKKKKDKLKIRTEKKLLISFLFILFLFCYIW